MMPMAIQHTHNDTDSAIHEEHTASLNLQPSTVKPHEEHQYLNLIRQILDDGEHRPDRYWLQHFGIDFT